MRFHYELDGVNCHGVDVPLWTGVIFQWLTRGGTFVLKIKTDFSGTRPAVGVHNNRYCDYVNLFRTFGDIVSITDGSGRPLRSERDARSTLMRRLLKITRRGIIIVTRKVA